ncbi:uncharacterized protein TNCV_628121 [Trichonephila clavipes]|nr:uncharacterized protein TNCV_628121 [Trichonephila clavipes]
MHWRHRFMLFIKLSDTGIGSEDQTQSKSLVSAHVTTLEEDLKEQPLCQDSPKDVLSDSGLRSSWPFHSFQTVILQILLKNPSSVRSCIIIHQNEVVTNSSSI